MAKLKSLDWRISSAPFIAVWQFTPEARTQGKMITGKDNTSLLLELLLAHLAPTSKAQIERALRSYRQLRGSRYPVPAEELVGNIVTAPPWRRPTRRACPIRSPKTTPTSRMNM